MLEYGYYNMDCMKGLAEFPDSYFDLAIVDPPIWDKGKRQKRTPQDQTEQRQKHTRRLRAAT